MKIISYNVNGIRAALSKDLIGWLKAENPDVLCVQETKAQPEQIDKAAFEAIGYQCHCFSAEKKGYSGVAIFSKQTPDKVVLGTNNPKYDVEGRVIRADFGDVTILNAYFPSGTRGGVRQEYKMEFLTDIQQHAEELRKTRPNLILAGDYNICRLWIDIHNPEKQQKTSGFLPEEREWFQQFVNAGYVDSFREFNPEPHHYSWWSYRAGSRQRNKGWRIDYNMVTAPLKERLSSAGILPDVVHSDHCPVMVEIKE